MFYKKSIGRYIFEIINAVILLTVVFICIAPILHVLFASISEPTKLASHEGIILFPLGNITLKGYSLVFHNPNIISGYLNTLFYVSTGTAISVLLTILGGYAFSRKNFLLHNPLMLFVSFTLLFNGGLIPTYMVIRSLGFIDTRWAIIIPSAISVFNLVIVRTSFMQIPASIEESAKLDGANDFTVLFRIMLPVSKAVIAVIVLFYAVFQWNSWFTASIYLRDRRLYPLQLILREILVQNDTTSIMQSSDLSKETDFYKSLVKYSTIIVATIPIMTIYPFVQKYFVQGVMIGAIKG